MLKFNQSQKLFIPGETIQNIITSAKWNLNPEHSNAWSPRRQGKKVTSIFDRRSRDLLPCLNKGSFFSHIYHVRNFLDVWSRSGRFLRSYTQTFPLPETGFELSTPVISVSVANNSVKTFVALSILCFNSLCVSANTSSESGRYKHICEHKRFFLIGSRGNPTGGRRPRSCNHKSCDHIR